MIRLTPEEMKAKKDEREAVLADFAAESEVFRNLLPELNTNHRWLFYKVFSKRIRLSLREKIKAKCLDCCAYQKEEVRQCTCEHCPLWDERPYQ